MLRIGLCGLLAVAIWLVSLHGRFQAAPAGLDAPATQFSAARAQAALGRLLGPQKPHPIGSAENAAVRARLLEELSALGVAASVRPAFSCNSEPRWKMVECGPVNNVVAQIRPGQGKAVLLMAHLDSVAAGPGACDDGCGMAALLESIRALRARGDTGGHPILALFSDGEEAGLLGAAAALRDPALRDRIGAVINAEARGNQGTSYLFQTSAGDGPLIDLYARAVPHVAASSIYAEVYKRLPNDTDLTPVLHAGITGMNFAFLGNVAQYHTPLDRQENIDPASLQGQGDNVLESAHALAHADWARLHGEDAIYFDVLGRWLPRLPQSWALPLSAAVLALVALAGLVTRRGRREILRPYTSFLMPPLLLVLAVGAGFALHGLAVWIAGSADPSFAYPVWLRLSLAFGVFAAALLAALRAGAVAPWLWFALLAVASAIWLPGASPYFLFPALVAAPLLLATAWGGRGPVLVIAALAALVPWIGLTATGEQIMGLTLHPLFTVTAAMGLVTLLPVLARAPRRTLLLACGGSLVLALGLAVVAGFQAPFSATAPERLNLRYVEKDGRAWWVADAVEKLPDSLRKAAPFSAAPVNVGSTGYAAPAGAAHLPAPAVVVARQGDSVTLDIAGDGFMLDVPRTAGLTAASVNGQVITLDSAMMLVCSACGPTRLVLTSPASEAQRWRLTMMAPGLPPGGARLQQARAPLAVPSREGDMTLLVRDITIPPRP